MTGVGYIPGRRAAVCVNGRDYHHSAITFRTGVEFRLGHCEPRGKQKTETFAKQGITSVPQEILEALGIKGVLAQRLSKLDGIHTKLGKDGEIAEALGPQGNITKVFGKLNELDAIQEILHRILMESQKQLATISDKLDKLQESIDKK
jgi:hypothetical protein